MNIINGLKPINYVKFKSSIPEYEDDGVLGCSDSYSQAIREKIRRDDYTHTIPEINSHYTGSLNESQLAALLDYYAPKFDVKDTDSILKLPNVSKAQNVTKRTRKILNIYRGETLEDKPDWMLETVKRAGVKTVIDLVDFGDYYKEKIENAGLNYYCYPIERYVDSHSTPNKEKKDKLIEFIKEMQKDNIYIACSCGTDKTYIGLLLNNAFNPQFNTGANLTSEAHEFSRNVDTFIRSVYPYMTEEDKKSIGWTPAFEEDFKRRYNKDLSDDYCFL